MWTLLSLQYCLPFLSLIVPGRMIPGRVIPGRVIPGRGGQRMEHQQESIPSWGITWIVVNLFRQVCIVLFTFILHCYVFTLTFWNEFSTKKISCRHHISLLTFQLRLKPQPWWNICGIGHFSLEVWGVRTQQIHNKTKYHGKWINLNYSSRETRFWIISLGQKQPGKEAKWRSHPHSRVAAWDIHFLVLSDAPHHQTVTMEFADGAIHMRKLQPQNKQSQSKLHRRPDPKEDQPQHLEHRNYHHRHKEPDTVTWRPSNYTHSIYNGINSNLPGESLTQTQHPHNLGRKLTSTPPSHITRLTTHHSKQGTLDPTIQTNWPTTDTQGPARKT